jgi:hypothetical protein
MKLKGKFNIMDAIEILALLIVVFVIAFIMGMEYQSRL